MDATTQTALMDSEIINELLSLVTHCFKSANSPYGLRNHQRTTVTGDAWIRRPKQPLWLKYHQRTAVTGDAYIRQPKEPLGTQRAPTNCCYG